MKSLDNIAEDLFNKIRSRFPSITIGNEEGKVTSDPATARYFDFEFKESGKAIGQVSISLSEDSIAVMYSNTFVENEDELTKNRWYDFLKELRSFAKKRLLKFDTRDINKSNLNRRDYKFLAQQSGETPMSESKLYGTSRVSYQDIGSAKLNIRHNQSVNPELPTTRTQHIDAIYIESAEGERFKYPYRHLNGARAMARHVAEGGKPYDDFGQHITGLSEELGKLRKFKNYVNRSSVMAEGLQDYISVVGERIENVKNEIARIQKQTFYKEALENHESVVLEEVPDDIKENWIDQLTIRQFNEELKDIFPYIYRLVGEATRAKEVGPDELLGESPVDSYTVKTGDTLYSIARRFVQDEMKGMSVAEAAQMIADANGIENPDEIQPGMELEIPYVTGAVGGDPITGEPITRGPRPGTFESELENSFESMMGQFGDLQEGRDVDEEHVRNLLKQFDHEAKDHNMYGDVNPETVIRHLEQGDVEAAIDEVHHRYAGPDGEEGDRGFEDLVSDLEDDFRYVVDHDDDDGQPSSYDEYQDLHGGDDYDFGQFDEGRDDAPEGDRITTDENPLVTSYDDEFDKEPGISGHMNLKTWMSIHAISSKYQEQLAKAVVDAGRGEKIRIPDEVAADYNDERDEEGLKPRALWIELSQHHEAEKASDAGEQSEEVSFENYALAAASAASAGDKEFEYPKGSGKMHPVKMGKDKAREILKDALEGDDSQVPLEEFILSLYDRETGEFPKGETAVLTKIEKDFGENYINDAKDMIEQLKIRKLAGL
jgi:hypothetical protein